MMETLLALVGIFIGVLIILIVGIWWILIDIKIELRYHNTLMEELIKNKK